MVEPQEKTDAEKQKQTVSDMRDLGTALFSWLTDQVGAAAAGQQTDGATSAVKNIDVQDAPPISQEELEKLLVPQYLSKIPETDGWGNPYEVRLNLSDVMAKRVMGIRSPGKDGVYSSDIYSIEGFDPTDFDQDIVWADGFFVRWPSTLARIDPPLLAKKDPLSEVGPRQNWPGPTRAAILSHSF